MELQKSFQIPAEVWRKSGNRSVLPRNLPKYIQEVPRKGDICFYRAAEAWREELHEEKEPAQKRIHRAEHRYPPRKRYADNRSYSESQKDRHR